MSLGSSYAGESAYEVNGFKVDIQPDDRPTIQVDTTLKDVPRKRFKTIGPPTEADIARHKRIETAQMERDKVAFLSKERCPATQTWTGEMLGYSRLRCLLENHHSGECRFSNSVRTADDDSEKSRLGYD